MSIYYKYFINEFYINSIGISMKEMIYVNQLLKNYILTYHNCMIIPL